MSIFSRPYFLAVPALIALLAGLTGGPRSELDTEILRWLAQIRETSPQFTSFVAILTQMGSAYVTLLRGILEPLGISGCSRRFGSCGGGSETKRCSLPQPL